MTADNIKRFKAVNAEIKDVQNRVKEVLSRIKKAEDGRAVEILESVPGIEITFLAVIISETLDSVSRTICRALRIRGQNHTGAMQSVADLFLNLVCK